MKLLREDFDTVGQIWQDEVGSKVEQVDPDNELHWLALATGWAIGKGYDIEGARDFASWLRYSQRKYTA